MDSINIQIGPTSHLDPTYTMTVCFYVLNSVGMFPLSITCLSKKTELKIPLKWHDNWNISES